jgi:hypothetical protein
MDRCAHAHAQHPRRTCTFRSKFSTTADSPRRRLAEGSVDTDTRKADASSANRPSSQPRYLTTQKITRRTTGWLQCVRAGCTNNNKQCLAAQCGTVWSGAVQCCLLLGAVRLGAVLLGAVRCCAVW